MEARFPVNAAHEPLLSAAPITLGPQAHTILCGMKDVCRYSWNGVIRTEKPTLPVSWKTCSAVKVWMPSPFSLCTYMSTDWPSRMFPALSSMP